MSRHSTPVTGTRTTKLIAGVVLGAVLLGGCELFMSPERRLERAEASMQAGDHSAAIVDLKNVLQRDADNARARLLIARAELALGDVGAAAIDFERVDAAQVAAEEYQPVLWRLRLAQRRYDDVLAGLAEPVTGLAEAERQVLVGRAQAALGNQVAARAAFEAAMQADPRNGEARAGLGGSLLALGEPQAARETLEAARRDLPQSGEVARALGEVLVRQGQFDGAERAFRDAVQASPPRRDAQAHLAASAGLIETLLVQQKLDEAQVAVTELERNVPSAGMTLLLKGRVAAARRDYPVALESLQRLLNADPDNAQVRTLLAAVNLEQGNLELAATNLRRVVANNPEHQTARRLLAQVQMAQGRPKEAQATLDTLAAGGQAGPEILLMQARAALAAGDANRAIRLLERLESQGVPTEAARLDLAQAFIQAGRPDRALKLLDAAGEGSAQREQLRLVALAGSDRAAAVRELGRYAEQHPGEVQPVSFAALALAALGEADAARGHLTRLAEAHPENADVQANLARVEARAGRLDAAEAALQRLLRLRPSADVYVGLAELAAARGREDEATRWLEQGRDRDAKATGVRFLLARAYLARRQLPAAQKVADELVALTGNRPEARLLSAGIALERNDGARALADVNEAVKLTPDSAQAWIGKGEVHERLGQREEARAALRRALSIAPNSALAAARLARFELVAGNIDAALDAARRAQQQPDTLAAGLALEGEVLLRANRPLEAARVFERLQAQQPSAQGAVWLYGARLAARSPAPEQVLTDWLRQNPGDVVVQLALAEHWQRAGQTARALASYDEVLKTQPNNVVALNNAAWLHSQQGDPRALPLARRAHELAPGNPAIADTLGWILVNANQLDEGAKLLREAATAAPGAPDIQYHLAVALHRQGNVGEARAILERILQEERAFEARPRAEELLGSLR